MRIGMLLDNSFPPDSRVENEAVSLINAGHEVFLFSLCFKNLQPLQETINGIKVRRYPANKLIYKLSALAYSFPGYHALIKPKIRHFLNENKIESLHIHDMMIAQAAFDVNKEFKLPVVLDLHENRPEIMRHYPWVNDWKGRLLVRRSRWAKMQTEFIKKADRVIVVTEEAVQQAIFETGISNRKIIAVPNTITPDIYFNYPIKQEVIDRFRDKFAVLYLGDTGLRRGTDLAIEAVAILKRTIPNVHLILVGKSKEDFILKNLAEKLGVAEEVSFEGWQDVSLFPSYTLASEVCISPLVRNLHHDTTYANKIFQYMAMSRPIVVSDCPPQVRVAEEEQCGLVHQAGNAQDLADKILELYRNSELRQTMGCNGQKAVRERYNWQQTSRDLIEMYNALALEFKLI